MVNHLDEPLFLQDEEQSKPTVPSVGCWKVLIVDDDREMHAVTTMALSDVVVCGRPLEFLHAYNGIEALEILGEHDNIAMVLLDVVMETDDAGLRVAKAIREQLGNQDIRIVLRTGQPGYAPEESVIKDYDINDYKNKTELTRRSLITTVFSAVRAYQQLRIINDNRQGLRQIIHSASNLMEKHSLMSFSAGVISQIASLLGLHAEGIIGARAPHQSTDIVILGAAGDFSRSINKSLSSLGKRDIETLIKQCLNEQRHIYTDSATVFYIDGQSHQAAAYLKTHRTISVPDQEILEVFLANISIGFENAQRFEELKSAAYRDPLTGIPNRAEFIRQLDGVSVKPCNDRTIGVIDINHFSDVNDGLGQKVGDTLLQAVSQRLCKQLGETVMVARVSADVFGLCGPSDKVSPEVINDLFRRPFKAGEHDIPLRVTGGFTSGNNPETVSGTGLLNQVYLALKNAKNNSFERYDYYAPWMEQETQRRLELVGRLRSDFVERKLQVWYQPQVALATQKIIGVEALLRWPQSDGSYISPAEFIPLAESSGLIVEMGSWVIEQACKQLKAFDELGLPELTVAVNVSVPQFRKRNFPKMVEQQMERWQVNPQRIELEITESIVMEDPDLVVDILKRLKQQGVQIAIDDFGVGFSSLSYLQKLPLDRIKIDKTFVDNSERDSGQIIIETIIGMATRLGLEVVAEGIETQAQLSYLTGLNCSEGQGYFFAKPMPSEQLKTVLTSK